MDRDLCTQRVMIFLISSFISLVGGEVPRCSLSDFVTSLTFLNMYSSICIKYYTINDFKRSVKHTCYVSPASGVSRAFSSSTSYLTLMTSGRLGSLILGSVDMSLSLHPPPLLLTQTRLALKGAAPCPIGSPTTITAGHSKVTGNIRRRTKLLICKSGK